MLRFWRNPEFVRHARAELRAPRAFTAAALVLIVSVLLGLSIWSSEHDRPHEFFALFHRWLLGIEFVLLGFWCASANGQAISRERELKNYDFLRTTRLSPTELMVGKVLGAPITAYFVVGCSMPISFVAGMLADVPLQVLVWDYALMLAFALFVSLAALWASMLGERSSIGVLFFLAYMILGQMFSYNVTPLPGIAAVFLLPSVFSLYNVNIPIATIRPTLFGLAVSFPFMTVLLYLLLGAWLALMVKRNIKKDREQIRLLSRWQAIGFAAFLNLLFFALLDPDLIRVKLGLVSPYEVSELAVGFNAAILFLIGLATITPHEKLKIWWRKRSIREESYLSEYGLPWPWLVPAALIAYVLLVAEATGLREFIPIQEWRLETVAMQLFVALVFTARDILFLQWCNLTRMKRPLVKGFLYLTLYYAAIGVLTLFADAIRTRAVPYIASLTPFYALTAGGQGDHLSSGAQLAGLREPAIYIDLALQIPAILILLGSISDRLRRPAVLAEPASSGN